MMSAQAPLTVAQRKRCRARDTKARRSPIEEPAWVARKLTKRSVPSPRRPVVAAEGPRAVPSLRLPSAPAFPAAPATLVVPRIAATDETGRGGDRRGTNDGRFRDSDASSSREKDKTFVFRQIIEYPAMSDAAVAALDRAVHAEADASLEHARVAKDR